MIQQFDEPPNPSAFLPVGEPILTAARSKRKDVKVEEGERGGVQYRAVERPLDYYVRRRHITVDQYRAGHRFFTLWHFSILRLRYSRMNYGEIGGGADLESIALIPHEYLQARASIKKTEARELVYHVCCMEKTMPKRGMMELLTDGLDDLARHFRFEA